METKLPKSIYRSFIVGFTLLASVIIPAGLRLILGLAIVIVAIVMRYNYLKKQDKIFLENGKNKSYKDIRGRLK